MLMRMLKIIKDDYIAVRKGDPSIPAGLRGFFEIVFCTPGFWAIFAHRMDHFLYKLGLPVIPRFLSLVARWITGIEIHPGAQIGKGVFIDHGMGVVIGQTAIVGDNVILYQGVTLGATGNEKGAKRHPTVKSGAFIGCGARILGDITVGENSRVGSGAIVIEDVPSDTTVVGIPAVTVKSKGRHIRSPKHLLRRIEQLEEKCAFLGERVAEMEDALMFRSEKAA